MPGSVPDRVFVDSGGWIALLSARDAHHAEAEELFRTAVSHRVRLLTTNLVIAETHRALLFRAGPVAALRALDRIEASPRTALTFVGDAEHATALHWLRRLDDQEISYTDAASFAVMTATRCRTVLGFDRDFVIAGFTLWRSQR